MSKIAITVVDSIAARPRHIKLRLPDSKSIGQITQFLTRKYAHLAEASFTLHSGGELLDPKLTLKDVAARAPGRDVFIELRADSTDPADSADSDTREDAGFADALAAFEAADPDAPTETPAPSAAPPGPPPAPPESAQEGAASASLADTLASLDDENDGDGEKAGDVDEDEEAGAGNDEDMDRGDEDREAETSADDPQAQPGETQQRKTPYEGNAAKNVADELAGVHPPGEEGHVTPLPGADYHGRPAAGVADALAAVNHVSKDAPPTPPPSGPYEGEPADALADTLAVVDNVDPQPTALPSTEYTGPPAEGVAEQLAEDMPGPGVTPLPVGDYQGASPAAMASVLADDDADDANGAKKKGAGGGRAAAFEDSTERFLLGLQQETEATANGGDSLSENADFIDNRANPSAALPVVHADDGETAEVPVVGRGVPPVPGLRDIRADDRVAPGRPPEPVIRELSGEEAERVREQRRESERVAPRAPTGGRVLRRRARVTYFERMTTGQVFPVTVEVARELGEPRNAETDSVLAGGELPFEVDGRRPVVSVRAVFPGCVVSASQVTVDLASERAEVRVWVTPIAAGEHYDGCVEIWQHGRRLESIATPFQVASRRTPVLTALVGAVFPALSAAFALLRDTAGGTLTADTGFLSYLFLNIWPGMALFAPLAGIAGLLWWKNRPREAMPKERPFACDDRLYEV